MQNPLGEITTTAWNAAGWETVRIDGRGFRTSFTYDDAGRQPGRFTYQYDAAGRLSVAEKPIGGRLSYLYDAADQLLSEHRDVLNSPAPYLATFTWDQSGRRLQHVPQYCDSMVRLDRKPHHGGRRMRTVERTAPNLQSCGGFLRAYRDLLKEGEESSRRRLRRTELEHRGEKLMSQFFAYYLRNRGDRIDVAEAATSTYPPPKDSGPPN